MGAALDRLFAGVLLLGLTNAFVIAAPVAGTRVAAITAGLVSFILLYGLYRAPVATRLLAERKILFGLLVILVWPAATALYAPEIDGRLLGVHVTLAANFFGGALYVRQKGWESFRRLVGWAVGISALGLVGSTINPGLFQSAAELTGSRGAFGERAFGFFLQPNTAASSITLLGAVWVASQSARSTMYYAGRFVCVLTMVLLTGSRGGLATVGAFGVALIAFHGRTEGRSVAEAFVLRMVKSARVIGAICVIGGVGSLLVVQLLRPDTLDYYLDRAKSIVAMTSLESITADKSGSRRLRSQRDYMEMIAKRPITGFGLGAHEEFIRTGRLYLSSHNAFLDTALQFGVPYLIAVIIVLMNARARWLAARRQEHSGGDFSAVLALTVCASGLFVGTLLQSRILYVLVGGLTGLMWRPTYSEAGQLSLIGSRPPREFAVATRA